MSFSSIFRKLAKLRVRPLGFLERVVFTPRARHTPEKTDRRVELCRFSRFAELIPRRRIGLSRFSRFVSKSWQTTRPVGHSSTCTSDLYRLRVRLSRVSSSAGPGRARPGRAGPGWIGPHLARGRAAPGRAGARRAVTGALPGFGTRPAARLRRTRPAGFRHATGGRASEHDRRQGFGAHDRGGLRHATGGRASERDQASAHTTGPGFGTPLAQLIPSRRIGLCRRFPRFLQLSPC